MSGASAASPSALVLDAMCLNHFARVDRLDVLRELLIGDECQTTYVVLDERSAEVRRYILFSSVTGPEFESWARQRGLL